MDLFSTDWWKIVGGPLLLVSAPIVLKWLWSLSLRGDRKIVRDLFAAEKRDALLLSEREALSKEQRETFERVEAERDRAVATAEREVARRLAAERDRNRGWNLARFYYQMAWELSHALKNARQMVLFAAAKTDPPQEVPEWVEIVVPLDMEAPIPKDATD